MDEVGMAGRGRHSSPRGYTPSKKLIIACSALGFICLYALYSWSGTRSARSVVSGGGRLKRYHTWKTQDFVDIPTEILDKAKSVQIDERTLSFDFYGQQLAIFYREVGAKATSGSTKKGFTILLLHGAGSSSEVWVKVGTLKLLGVLGYRVVAVDLPGWANSRASSISNGQVSHFLQRFIEQEKLGKPLIVSPSMSGSYAIPFMMEPEPGSCHERMRAYIPLAPVSTGLYKDFEYHRCEIPVMIVYGTKDVSLGLQSVGHLRNMPNSEIFPMEGAKHANYEERPDEWNQLLYNFILALQRDSD